MLDETSFQRGIKRKEKILCKAGQAVRIPIDFPDSIAKEICRYMQFMSLEIMRKK